MKRAFDVLASLIGLAALSPVLVTLAAIIKLTDGGPVFYRGVRAAYRTGTFRIFKFRSMVVNAEKIGGPTTGSGDPRITSVGHVMRKYKLDELPQLINVLLGDMSLVGPRPEVKRYTDQFTPEERPILSVRPGITDWASIWNSDEQGILAGHPDADRGYEELIRPTKLKLQLFYVRTHGVVTDLRIIALTFAKLVRKDRIPREIVAEVKRVGGLMPDQIAACSKAEGERALPARRAA